MDSLPRETFSLDSLPREIKTLIRDYIKVNKYIVHFTMVNKTYYNQLYDRSMLLPQVYNFILSFLGFAYKWKLSTHGSIISIHFDMIYKKTVIIVENAEKSITLDRISDRFLQRLRFYLNVRHPEDKSVGKEIYFFDSNMKPSGCNVIYY